jgi:N-acyl-D-aspartate/D-glutamate deacylase
MLDVAIRGGMLIDGTGAPARPGDVGIRGGRIAALGRLDEPARRTIDASGRIVAPGFVDIHTHYDAQVFWDRSVSPSSFHGVTTIVGGNCGFSIAPLSPEAGDYLMRMLARVEGMPLESLQQGVPWSWRSFAEYLGLLDGKLAINAGFLVGHSALRRVVMGERAVGQHATAEELEQLVALLRRSLADGGLGFSSSRAITHSDGNGDPVPSRHAHPDELLALARAVRDFPGTTLELLPAVGVFGAADRELMIRMSLEARRPLNWNVLAPSSSQPELPARNLAASDEAAQRGAQIVALTVPQPMKARLNFLSGFALDMIPGWAKLFGLPLDERRAALRDAAVRERLRKDAESGAMDPAVSNLANFANMTVEETYAPQNRGLAGRTLGEIADERGTAPFDVMMELVLSDDLKTSFGTRVPGQDDARSWQMRADAWRDPRTVIGASDAGAHLDMLDTFAFSTQLLGGGVRERGLLSWEEAVHQLSDVPARLYGIRERGRLAPRWHADVVVFDPQSVATGPTYMRFDLPGGAGRLYADAVGVDHVFVNGVEIVAGTELTGETPGTVLRSGRDTDTVEVPGDGR